MRLRISKSAHSRSFSVIKSAYINKKRTTVTVELLGNEKYIMDTYGVDDAEKWARDYVARLNKSAADSKVETTVSFDSSKLIPLGEQRSFNGGYLFLQSIYYDLGLNIISKAVKIKHSFEYDLNAILSRLIYTRILYPSSKISSFEASKNFIEKSDFELHQIYRALSVLSSDTDYIQARLYKNSQSIEKRRTNIIYYDCTNFFFEIEEADASGLRQFGYSKEHRPNPIVQMGLFMDKDGIPLAFCINPGNTNEQQTLRPLEEKLMEDFDVSRFIVCTDAGLSSQANREFNNKGERAYITTQSLKKLKGHLKEWALAPQGWKAAGSDTLYDLHELDDEKYRNHIFYKERWINENGLEQRLIVTYSIKTREYQRYIRSKQTTRAVCVIENSPNQIEHRKQTDYKRFINGRSMTSDGEVADRTVYELDEKRILLEASFDGFYGVCTNLEGQVSEIIKVNQRRWEIEECFRIMKSEFKARPVYLQRDDRIQAHFLICFLSLILFRYLEKKLDNRYSCEEIIRTLREMNFHKIEGHGYIPSYKRSELTDALHEAFGFNTAKEIISITDMKKICSKTKKTGV